MSTLDTLTVKDMRDFRDQVGFSMERMGLQDKTGQALADAGLVWILERRTEPGLAFDDVCSRTLTENSARLRELAPDMVAEPEPEPGPDPTTGPDGTPPPPETDSGSRSSPATP